MIQKRESDDIAGHRWRREHEETSMAEHQSAGASEADPLKSVADAMETAVQAARDGASDARAAVDRAIPAISQFVSRFVYTTSYSLSYGVVFPVMLMARAIPKDNAFVHGLVDGAHAAREVVEDWQTDRASSPAAPAAS
jgi:hypothetical protein